MAKNQPRREVLEKTGKTPNSELPHEEKVHCLYCGQIFSLKSPYMLPKHRNPIKEGQDPLKVAFCVGQGKQGKTFAAVMKERIEKKKEQKRQSDRQRRQQLRLV